MKCESFPIIFNILTICITGESKERFLNLCRNKEIYLWDIKLNDNSIVCRIKRNEFRKIRPVCRTTGCKVYITRKYGLKYLAFKYRKHYSFAIGIITAFLIVKGINNYVWDISFQGNSIYSDQYIYNYLCSLGIDSGIKTSGIDCEWLEHKIREDFSEVTWVSVSKKGTRVIISFKENDGVVIQDEDEHQGDIYATDDGEVISIITRKGTPMVKKGDNVTKDQILVSGHVVVNDAYGEEICSMDVQPDADILIKMKVDYCDTLYRDYKRKEYTGKTKTSIVIDAFGKEINLLNWNLDENTWDRLCEEKEIKLFNKISLPVKYNIIKYNQYDNVDYAYTDEEMEEILTERFDSYIKNLQNSVQILDKDVKIVRGDGLFEMRGSLEIISPAFHYGVYDRN